ncbi:hypothetical protein Rsub_11794, partial [Raphidocelis subcapitata]
INAAIEDVLLEAACEEDDGLDFAAFAALARVPSEDLDLDHYDARLPRGPSAAAAAAPAAAPVPVPVPARAGGGEEGLRRGSAMGEGLGAFAGLETVPEADG